MVTGGGRQLDERTERHRLALAQPPVQRHRRAIGLRVQPVGVVHLVGLAGADGFVDALDGLGEGAQIGVGLLVHHAGRGMVGILRFEPGVGFGARELLQLAKHQHAQRRGGVA